MTTKYLDENGLRHLLSEIRSDVTPIKDGTAAVGTSKKLAKADHVHPSDTTKVDKVSGKGLSTNDYTTAEKNKLANIEAGAEVNVNADWDATSGDAEILNKPTSMTPTSHTHGHISNDGKITNVGAVSGNVWRFIMADAGGSLYRAGVPFDTSSDNAKNVLKQSGAFEALEATDIWYDTNVTVGDAIDSKAPKASPAFTGTPTAPTATAGTNTTQIATTAFVKMAVDAAATGAVAYQGTVPISGQTGGFAPTNTTAGWYWIVQTAGTYAGVVCEAGDMIFCRVTSSTYSASNFDVIQTNLDIATMTNAEIEAAISA